jgi:hypothetical protein
VKRLLLLGGALAGLWAWLRGRRRDAVDAEAPASVTPITPTPPPPPPEPTPPADADPAVREAESRLDDETKFERAVEAEGEARHDAAERVKEDAVTKRPEPPDEAA